MKLIVLLCLTSIHLVYCRSRKVESLKLDGRIVGGKPTDITEYPWQVSLQRPGGHICGGCVISSRWILTAAHCFMLGPSGYTIRAGSTNHKYGGRLYDVEKVIIHKQYTDKTNDYDIAVIKVEKPINLRSRSIKAVKLPNQNEEPYTGAEVTVTGWGRLHEQGSIPSKLQKVEVPIISRKLCQQLYGRYTITDRMICAGYAEGKRDACQGDSGGPLVLNNVLYGLVSWGLGCAQPKKPGVYTNVAMLRSWIKEKSGV